MGGREEQGGVGIDELDGLTDSPVRPWVLCVVVVIQEERKLIDELRVNTNVFLPIVGPLQEDAEQVVGRRQTQRAPSALPRL